MVSTDSIENRGFLSVEVEKYRSDYRAAYAQQFAVCEEKSEAATKHLFSADLSVFDTEDKRHVIVAIAHWIRCVSSCQGWARKLSIASYTVTGLSPSYLIACTVSCSHFAAIFSASFLSLVCVERFNVTPSIIFRHYQIPLRSFIDIAFLYELQQHYFI
jgi:hypothetical protein